VLDRHFEDVWNACTPHQRKWRMAKGQASYRTAELMREQLRLTLSPEKTRITHVDDGFDFLGFCIQRRPRVECPSPTASRASDRFGRSSIASRN
jgi:hypothetical protein